MIEIKAWESNIVCWAESYFYTEFDYIPKSFISFAKCFCVFILFIAKITFDFCVRYIETFSWSLIIYNNVFVLERKAFCLKKQLKWDIYWQKYQITAWNGFIFTFRTDLMDWLYCTCIKMWMQISRKQLICLQQCTQGVWEWKFFLMKIRLDGETTRGYLIGKRNW